MSSWARASVSAEIGITVQISSLDARALSTAEVSSLRGLTRLSGYGLIAIGALLVAVAVFANMVVAMPWSRLFTRAGFWAGTIAAITGVALVRRGHGR